MAGVPEGRGAAELRGGAMSDERPIFLSYAPEQEGAVEAIALRLRDEARLPVWFAPWSAVPGVEFQRQLEEALAASRACVVFVGGGAAGISGWQSEELRAAIEARVDMGAGYRVVTVFLPGERPVTRRELPAFLRNTVQPNLEIAFGAGKDEQALRRLVAGALGVPPAAVEERLRGGSVPGAPRPLHQAPAYASLALTFGPAQGGAARTVAARGPAGDARGGLALPTADPALLALVARGEADAESARKLGELLFGALFQGELRDAYARGQGALRQGERLRLVLDIPAEDVALAALPWELLHDPQQGPLALLGVSVVRYLPRALPAPQLRGPGPLRVLLSAAQTPPPAPVERELAAAREALESAVGRIAVAAEPRLTPETLRRRLREGFHAWHFVGHGAAGDAGPGLVLEDARGDPLPVSAAELQALLSHSGVRLALLSACEAGEQLADPLRGVATALVSAGVAAVVAMRFGVPAEATRAFSAELWRALAEGWPLDACVAEGRKAVQGIAPGRADWAIPALYTRAPDGWNV
jgi:hypothetical protein